MIQPSDAGDIAYECISCCGYCIVQRRKRTSFHREAAQLCYVQFGREYHGRLFRFFLFGIFGGKGIQLILELPGEVLQFLTVF